MSDRTYGPDDPLSADELAAAVSVARPDWRLASADPIEPGSDIIYRCTVETNGRDGETVSGASGDSADPASRDVVLKCFRDSEALSFRTHRAFLTEVEMFEIASAETDLPVPAVHGVCRSHGDLPTPLFLMTHMEGLNAALLDVEADAEKAERFAREAGRALARIHDLRSFDAFGDVVAEDGELRVEDPRDELTDHLRTAAEFELDSIGETRFADLEEPLREAVDDRLATLDADVDPVLLHGDYRPGNLLADGDSGALTAVLDWGSPVSATRLSELLNFERDLADAAPVDSPTRRRLRSTLFDAYEDERGVAFERDREFERRVSFYRLLHRVVEMRWFPYWYEAVPEDGKAERARELRDLVEPELAGD